MPTPVDLSSVIEDAISDSQVPDSTPDTPETDVTPGTDTPVDTPSDVPADSTNEVQSPAAKVEAPADPEDPFAKEFGLQPQVPGQRENRIPQSRVKDMVEKAKEKALAPLTAELTTFKEKVADYEKRLGQVNQFEQIMVEQPEKFIQMLTNIPAYREIFSVLAQVEAWRESQQAGGPGAPPQGAPPQKQEIPGDPMPEMDQTFADGTKGYSMEGWNKFNEWNARQLEARITKQVEARYKPIEDAWNAQEQVNRLMPEIERKAAEARTWPMFTENEAAVIQAMKENPRLNLEGAYQLVVFPKLRASREQLRAEVLAEVKNAPRSTSTPSGAVKPGPPASSGPRSLQQVIEDSLREKGLK